MTPEFISRLLGAVVFAVVGARIGVDLAEFFNLSIEDRAFIFMLTGLLFGLIATPWFTVRPIRFARRVINEMPVEKLLMALAGAAIGLFLALLLSYPLSLVEAPFGTVLPAGLAVAFAYLGMTIFNIRAREILETLDGRLGRRFSRLAGQSNRQLLLDTSVLIDGRIVDIADTGFVGGQLIIPRFVLNELHRVADSSDPLRRNRGRRGLAKLNELQRNDMSPVKIIEDDIEAIADVDNKLVGLAVQMGAIVVTNDYNLNQVAEAQGVTVLNINELANAVRSIYIPGETFPLRIIQEGSQDEQGIGYLDDGTMVVVENGSRYMDRNIRVTVTKLINRPTGRMIFALPESEAHNQPKQYIEE